MFSFTRFLVCRNFSAFDVCLQHGREAFVPRARGAFQKLAEARGRFIVGFANVKTKLCEGSIILHADSAIVFETAWDSLLNRVIVKRFPIDDLIEEVAARMGAVKA